MLRALLLVPVTAALLTGCGGGDDRSAGEAVEVPSPTPTTAPTTASPEPTPAPAAPAPPPAAAPPARPAPGTCTDLPEAADGRYAVADAGTVVVTREGDRLVLGEVTPSEGWQAVEVEREEREVEVEFRRGGEEVDFEAEIEDDGRLDVEICSDDD